MSQNSEPPPSFQDRAKSHRPSALIPSHLRPQVEATPSSAHALYITGARGLLFFLYPRAQDSQFLCTSHLLYSTKALQTLHR